MKNRIHTGIAALVLMTLFLGMETGVSVRAMEGGVKCSRINVKRRNRREYNEYDRLSFVERRFEV